MVLIFSSFVLTEFAWACGLLLLSSTFSNLSLPPFVCHIMNLIVCFRIINNWHRWPFSLWTKKIIQVYSCHFSIDYY